MGCTSTTMLKEAGHPFNTGICSACLWTSHLPTSLPAMCTECCMTHLECGVPSPEDSKWHSMKAGVWQDSYSWTMHSFLAILPAIILHWTTSHKLNYLTVAKKKQTKGHRIFVVNTSLCRGKGCLDRLLTHSEFQMYNRSLKTCACNKKAWVIFFFANYTGNCLVLSKQDQIWSLRILSPFLQNWWVLSTGRKIHYFYNLCGLCAADR